MDVDLLNLIIILKPRFFFLNSFSQSNLPLFFFLILCFFLLFLYILPCGKNIVQNNWHDMRYDRKWWLKPPERSSRDFYKKHEKTFYISLKWQKKWSYQPIIDNDFFYINIETRQKKIPCKVFPWIFFFFKIKVSF